MNGFRLAVVGAAPTADAFVCVDPGAYILFYGYCPCRTFIHAHQAEYASGTDLIIPSDTNDVNGAKSH